MIRILFLFIVEIFFFSSIYASTTWKIENNTLYISGKGDMNVDAGILNNGIPDHSDETPWFLYRYNFNKLIIEEGVTSISKRAFMLCKNIESIVIPSSMKTIGDYAFNHCFVKKENISNNSDLNLEDYGLQIIDTECNDGLLLKNNSVVSCRLWAKSVEIPQGVTIISDNAFYQCRNLESITIPGSITSIGNNVFGYCFMTRKKFINKSQLSFENSGIEFAEKELPNGLLINGDAIVACRPWAKSPLISNNIKCIKSDAFYLGFDTPNSIVIPNTVTDIEYGAFYACTNLKYIVIPNSVKNIGYEAFIWCSDLESVILPNSITKLGSGIFQYCNKLDNLIIPSSVSIIERQSFYGCKSLSSITIPNSVTNIEKKAFFGCDNLASVVNLSTVPQVLSPETFEVYGTLHVLPRCKEIYSNADVWKNFTIVEDAILHNTIYYTSSDGNIVNPYQTDVFGANIVSNIYENGQGIITFDGDVTSIGDYAFSECRSLVSIKIPNSVTSIGDNAFDGCSSLMNTVIPNSVTNIGSLAFKNCPSIIDVIIPNSVKNIATAPFAFCPNIKSIKVDADNTVYDSRENCNAIINSSKNELIQGCVNTIIPKNVTKIGYGAFAGCEFTEMVIPNEVTDIGVDAFYGCKKLANIIIPRNVIFINCLSFYGCPELTNVTSLAATPPIFGSGEAFEYYGTLHVLPGCKTAYENAEYWNRFTIVEDAVDPSASIVLADGTPYNEETTQYNKDITYTRTFNNTSWQALYVPFAMSYEDWKDNFDVSYINGIRQYDKNEDGVIEETVMDVIMIKNGSLIPNTPYLIRAKSVGEKSITINNATLYKAEDNSIDCSTTIARYKFTGTYTPIPASVLIENNYYAMGGGALVISNGSDLKPYRWYMQIDARSPLFDIKDAAKRITINLVNEDDVVSSITEYTNTQQSSSDSQIYDLNGRKVSKSALKSGLYIKNGKKVVIKTNACE